MNWLTIVLKYLPVVLQAVMAVENSIGSQTGATKKQVVMNAIQAGAQSVATVDNAEVAGISSLVDNVVGTLNKSGVFAKKPTV